MIEGGTAGNTRPVEGGVVTTSPDAPMPLDVASYPDTRTERDRFVVRRRSARRVHDAWRHQGVLVEPERSADGHIESTATVFLTGRECPWRCVMCDLWQYTTADDTPRGAIPAQIGDAVTSLRHPLPTVIKLYNAGSFFDRRAVPPSDIAAIADHLAPFDRIIVEAHPSLIGDATWRFRDAVDARHPGARLEVAIGLETANPDAFHRLNKGIALDAVTRAARALAAHEVDVRMFVLIAPPFVPLDQQDSWLAESVRFASACGATATTLIPTRPGEGALQALAAAGQFRAPTLDDVERAAAIGLANASGRVFVDTWNLEALPSCPQCGPTRRARLQRFNLEQRLPAAVECRSCGRRCPS
ncbi:MAG TPA: hypothetical protein VMF13_00255 [Luteitalea sp.]|nr:hypothetical protein [Luteitalea sp.]